ncbi:uncharacterized protein LOC135462980 [Liolophura sinensis]|uniref:uncharacterized protein LOC135462980 n=1 Tax=Liolophura sinensis TaxID=3198878 RepID=UPI003159835F
MGNKILSEATREGLASNTDRFHRSTRNERIYKDHTSEIRRRVAEKLKNKRYVELKEVLRTLALLEPTPENIARYREICELDIDEDGESCEEHSKAKEEFLKRLDQSMAWCQRGEQRRTCATSDLGVTGPFHLKEAQNVSRGIMRQRESATNQFARPWADPRLVYTLATWEPNRKCHPRACRRVRFKDEIYDNLEDDCEPCQNSSDKIKESTSIDEKINREFDEPDNLYYDKNVFTNIASRLAIPFKTEACKRFHQKYTDPLPDLRTYHTFAKKHFFNGLHTSVFRG